MQFQVPQFTDVEDKIFGPLTLKQFVYVAGGVGMGFILWRSLPFFIALPLALGCIGSGFALAFIQINKKPLIVILESAVMYFVRSKLYLWDTNRHEKKKDQEEAVLPLLTEQNVPAVSENKLKSLAWSLDINERIRLDRERELQQLETN